MNETLHRYQTGELYHPERTLWPERIIYQYRANNHELLLFLNTPTAEEVADIARGDAELTLTVLPPALVFCCRFGGMPWSDSPYTWHLVDPVERTVPGEPATAKTRALMNIVLVDAETGVICALRALTLSPEFTRVLTNAIRAQSAAPWNGTTVYDEHIDAIYRQYPTSESFVNAAVARCSSSQR